MIFLNLRQTHLERTKKAEILQKSYTLSTVQKTPLSPYKRFKKTGLALDVKPTFKMTVGMNK